MWNQDTDARSVAAWLLQPHSIEEFASIYYERAPLHVPRGAAGYYDAYFSLDELQRILFGAEVQAESVAVFKDGTPARPESYIQKSGRTNDRKSTRAADVDVIDPDRVSALFAHGCSVVLDRVPTYSAAVSRLCRNLELCFGHRVSANMYLTPANSQGFSAHYDTHDTVLLQVAGSKHWRVYGPGFELPIEEENQRFTKIKPSPGEPIMEVDVHAGDLLYIPRGFMHEGKAGSEYSLHLTLNFSPVKWIDVLTEALSAGAFDEAVLRRTISTISSPRFDDPELLSALQRIFSETQLAAAAERLQRKQLVERRNLLEGQLEQLLKLTDLTETSAVAMRQPLFYEIKDTGTSSLLSFSGKVLKLPRAAAAIIHELENVSVLTVGELKRHDENALAIVQRLIKEGFVIQCGPSEFNGTEAVA